MFKQLLRKWWTLTLLLLLSCNPQPIDNYNGCKVVDKYINNAGTHYVQLQCWCDDSEYEFEWVQAVTYDYNRFNIGDKIPNKGAKR